MSCSSTSPCVDCKQVEQFHYQVSRSAWRRVVGATMAGVVCLPCFDKRAVSAGVDYKVHRVIFNGQRRGISFVPDGTWDIV